MKNIKELYNKMNYVIHIEQDKKGLGIEIKGDKTSVMTGLSMLVFMLKDRNNLDDDDILYAVHVGLGDDEEIEKEEKKNLDELFRSILK